jgi:hypothetical protein
LNSLLLLFSSLPTTSPPTSPSIPLYLSISLFLCSMFLLLLDYRSASLQIDQMIILFLS